MITDAAERYQLAIYNVPFDASSPHNYAVWQGFKLCRILALELEGRLNDKTALLAAVEAAVEKGYAERESRIRQLEETITGCDFEIADLRTIISGRDDRIKILEADLLKRDERIRELENAIMRDNF